MYQFIWNVTTILCRSQHVHIHLYMYISFLYPFKAIVDTTSNFYVQFTHNIFLIVIQEKD